MSTRAHHRRATLAAALSACLILASSPARADLEASTEQSIQASTQETTIKPSEGSTQGTIQDFTSSGSSSGNTSETSNNDSTSAGRELGVISMSILLGATLIVATVGILTFMISVNAAPRRDEGLRSYLQNHRRAVLQAAAVGGGPAVEDLATAVGVSPSHQGRFGAVLRASYPALRRTLEGVEIIELAHAREVLRTLVIGMLDDEVLRTHAAQFLEVELVVNDSARSWHWNGRPL